MGLSETHNVNLCFSLRPQSASVGNQRRRIRQALIIALMLQHLDMITAAGEEFMLCSHLVYADLKHKVDSYLASRG